MSWFSCVRFLEYFRTLAREDLLSRQQCNHAHYKNWPTYMYMYSIQSCTASISMDGMSTLLFGFESDCLWIGCTRSCSEKLLSPTGVIDWCVDLISRSYSLFPTPNNTGIAWPPNSKNRGRKIVLFTAKLDFYHENKSHSRSILVGLHVGYMYNNYKRGVETLGSNSPRE